MAEEIKATVVETEEKSIQEKEQEVQKNSGFDEESGMYKVDLTKPPVQEQEKTEEPIAETPVEEAVVEEVVEEKPEETKEEEEVVEETILEEITNEENTTDDAGVVESPEATDAAPQQEEVLSQTETQEQVNYPENIQELVKFMNETGGTLEDYVALNKDYDKFEQMDLLHEYYTQTKPHLTADEVVFLIDDKFSYDKELDDPKEVKRKELSFKEEVAQAKNHLNQLKDNYYKEIKGGSRLTPEAQKAMDFFNRYTEEAKATQKITQSQRDVFNNKTNSLFNDKFKGFEYNVGEKRFRFNVKNVNEVRENQMLLKNLLKLQKTLI
jgi:hypothetical protein